MGTGVVMEAAGQPSAYLSWGLSHYASSCSWPCSCSSCQTHLCRASVH